MDFFKLHNLKNINWPRPNQLDITQNLKLNIFNIKLASDQHNKKNHKIGTLCFYGGIFWYLHNVLHSIALICPAHSSQFMEWNNLGIKTFKHAICAPKCFTKTVGKPNNYQLYWPNCLKFCENISHNLLRPVPGKICKNSGMVHFAKINQVLLLYSMLQHIRRVTTPKLVPRNCLRYLQTT